MNMMRLFHGSKGGIIGEVAPKGRNVCDFGSGFYLGDEPSQPLTLICHCDCEPWFYTCELELDNLNVFRFTSKYEWMLYIAFCRGKCDSFKGTELYERIAHIGDNMDVIIGKIANDRMFMVLNDFFDGLITDKATIASLKILNLGTQYCLKTTKACSQLKILDRRLVSSAECANLRIRSENQRKRAFELTNGIYKKYRREGYFFDEFFDKFTNGVLPCS